MQSIHRAAVLCSLIAVLSLCLLSFVSADCYFHHPRGSNDRLNEWGYERNNDKRLFDSQNNKRGGYNVGAFRQIYYYEGSIVPLEWTNQHACGDKTGNNCDFIIQYACGDRLMRDGQTTSIIPTDDTQCANNDCDTDVKYGRHESHAWYNMCLYRSRNRGLFTANQYMQKDSSRFTRQNRNGNRHGYECPEERDYYPYWAPTMWKDIAIVTTHPDRCAAMQSQSQNVVSKGYCQYDPNQEKIKEYLSAEGWLPITKEECEADTPAFPNGTWIEIPAWGIPPPECVHAGQSRDNHLGNVISADKNLAGFPFYYNWTVPADISPHCVLRIRYNISTGDMGSFQQYTGESTITPAVDAQYNMVPLNPNNPDRNARFPSNYPIWETYQIPKDNVTGSFKQKVQDDDGDGPGGVKQSQPPSRDYTLRNNPQLDIFGDLLHKNTLTNDGLQGQPMIRVRLAINTAQYGRVFQDRSHLFEIRRRPETLKDKKIHNLSVRGKKGNIVEVYPGVEYDFVPNRLVMKQGDFIHIQWTGNNDKGAAGEGPGNRNGRDDRSNMLLLGKRVYIEAGQESNHALSRGHWARNYPALINDTTRDPPLMGWDFADLRMLAYFGLNSSYFDLGPKQALVAAEYYYMSSWENAYTNRQQKGLVVVEEDPGFTLAQVVDTSSLPQPVSKLGWTQSSSGRALLKQSNWDGHQMVPGGIMVSDVPPEAGDEDGTWFRVDPPEDLGVAPDTLWLSLARPMPENFFYKGKIEYKQYPDDEPIELLPASSFYARENLISITKGGFYHSTSVPNTAMIAGISLALIGIGGICLYLYWKVRVQPVGGWKAFWHSNKATGGKYDGVETNEGDKLVNASMPTSTSSPSPAPSPQLPPAAASSSPPPINRM